MQVEHYSFEKGIQKACQLIAETVTPQTLLFLSGGKTPEPLYQQLAEEKIIHPGAVAMVDERFGVSQHTESNEKMIKDTGFLAYLQEKNIPFYPMLQADGSARGLAKEYDTRLMFLIMQYPKKIAIMGIGNDGHIASIAPTRKDFSNPLFRGDDITLVDSFNDSSGPFKERITLTFSGLSLIDQFVVLAFGEEKKEALQKMLKPGVETEIPARFFMRRTITPKVILITDQDVK